MLIKRDLRGFSSKLSKFTLPQIPAAVKIKKNDKKRGGERTTKWHICNMPVKAKHCDSTQAFSFHHKKYGKPQTYTPNPTFHNLPAGEESIYSSMR